MASMMEPVPKWQGKPPYHSWIPAFAGMTGGV